MSTDLLSSAPKNPRGIPKAPFIDDPAAFVLKHESTEAALTGINDALAKYKYMESSLSTRRAGLEQKIPDIRKTLDMVQVLFDRRNAKGKLKEEDSDDLEDEDDDSANQPLTTTFELNDTLYAEATLDDTDEVYLWLGANVMLSYPLPQALTLLKEKLSAAEENLGNLQEDMEWLREQITVLEVNTARVYNFDVKRRREEKETQEKRP